TMVNDRGGFAECVTEARGRLAMLRSVVRRLWAGIQGGSPKQLLAARDRSGVQGGHADAHRERPTVCFEHAAWKGSGVGTLKKWSVPPSELNPGAEEASPKPAFSGHLHHGHHVGAARLVQGHPGEDHHVAALGTEVLLANDLADPIGDLIGVL